MEVVKFKRRVFGCVFAPEQIRIKDRLERTMSFEEVWDQLHEQIPEDLPFLEMKGFEQIRSEAVFEEKLKSFLQTGTPQITG